MCVCVCVCVPWWSSSTPPGGGGGGGGGRVHVNDYIMENTDCVLNSSTHASMVILIMVGYM